MKRKLKVWGGILLILVVALAILDYFKVEANTLAWHLRHGFDMELGDIRMRVPLSFTAHAPKGVPVLTMVRFDGHVWHTGGVITIDFRLPSTEALQTVEATSLNKWETRMKVGERALTFAGRSGTCFEYIPQLTDSSRNQAFQAIDPRDIDCWFGDVRARLEGTADLKDDFYGVIQSAEHVPRKN